MSAELHSETKRIRYLLGLSSQAERDHIELEYFENDDAFRRMVSTEDDLFDAYARDELTREERGIFEAKFVASAQGRFQVRFARAFAGIVSSADRLQTKPHRTLFDILKARPSWQGRLRVTTIAAAVTVLLVALSWLVIERRRLSNEVRELRAEAVALRKGTEELKHNADIERARTAEITAQLENLQAQSDKPIGRQGRKIATQRASKMNRRQEVANRRREPEKTPPHQSVMSTEGPLPGSTSIRPQGVVGLTSLNPGFFVHRLRPHTAGNTIDLPTSQNGIIFQLALETVAQHIAYKFTIKTSDGRPVISLNWIEALTPNQTRIDTPVISTVDLTTGNYRLVLAGKEPNGTYVQIAEYTFTIVRH